MKGEIYLNNLPQNPTITPTQTNYAFRYFCQKVLPTVYDESLSYYELLCKLTSKINEVIESSNKNGEAITELQNLYKQLKDYVDNYFSTVDLQDEIDAALNKMAESGDLATIISEYLNGINIYGFRTINDMKNAETIGIGSICRTLGDTDYKTGNGKFYYVRRYLTTDTIDDDNIIALINNPQAVAEKIPDYFYNTLSTNITDITTKIGTLTNLVTTEKTNLVGAINETNGNITTQINNVTGELSQLTTTTKTNLVGAINELNGETDTNANNIGTLTNLVTTEKTNLVGAINEVKTDIIPITRGGTNATTSENACINLGLGTSDTTEFTAPNYENWKSQVFNYIDTNLTERRPFVFNAGWQGVNYGSGFAFQTSNEYRFAMLANMSGGVQFFGKVNNNDWAEITGGYGTNIYNNDSGTYGTITLPENYTNYKFIDILYQNIDGEKGSCRFYTSGSGNKANIISMYTDGGDVYFKTCNLVFENASVSFHDNAWKYRTSGGTWGGKNEANHMRVYKLIGYK